MSNNQKVVEGARLSGQGHLKGKLVEFHQDVFPHVKGEIKKLDDAELKRVDDVAKGRGLSGTVYSERKLTSEEQAVVKADLEAAKPASTESK